MRKLFFLVFFCSQSAFSALPLSFTATPIVNNMAIGQVQILNYTIRNNLSKQSLPLHFSLKNQGDNQAELLTTLDSSCPSVLAPLTSCAASVVINGPITGTIRRDLIINYGGRAPLISSINASVGQAAYTILIYIVGSDLESKYNQATFNINQMKQIGSTSNMNIIIETGGANKNDWRTVQRQFILKNNAYVIEDLGSVNMGLTSTIEDFFNWGTQQYPADKYIAIFWNHGGGPNYGFGDDEVHSGAATPIKELARALQNVSQNLGRKFEIIGFDACFLGNVETYAGLYNYANYLVGSEDLEPGSGWQYNTFLNYVTQNPGANGLNVGKVIADGFTAQNNEDSTTLSVVTATQIPYVIDATTQFALALTPYINTSTTNWKQVARARLRAPDYGTAVWDNKSYDVADLIGLANGMAALFPSDAAIQNASSALVNAVNNAVAYYKNSANRSASFGLSIYFPSLLAAYVLDYPTKTVLNGQSFFSPTYTSTVANYYNYYNAQVLNLIAEPISLAFDGTFYTATVTNDFEELYAAAGSDTCNNVYNEDGVSLGVVPCYTALQSSGVESTPSGGNTYAISFNKLTHVNQWPLINNQAAILIVVDTEPVIPNEISYLIPVTKIQGNTQGYLNIIKDSNNNFIITGFQRAASTSNTQAKVADIADGEQFYLRTYAFSAGSWGLHRTDTIITAPFTITFGILNAEFNAFRFLVADLTGSLNITSTSVPY